MRWVCSFHLFPPRARAVWLRARARSRGIACVSTLFCVRRLLRCRPSRLAIRRCSEAGDKLEMEIVNRHRLLRRGRNYQRENEKGLFFVAICADLERQFEFVQRNWINSDNFQALDGETDPLVSKRTHGGNFTIPTAGGSILIRGLPSFVSLRAGGYFFIPSKSALIYLSNLADDVQLMSAFMRRG